MNNVLTKELTNDELVSIDGGNRIPNSNQRDSGGSFGAGAGYSRTSGGIYVPNTPRGSAAPRDNSLRNSAIGGAAGGAGSNIITDIYRNLTRPATPTNARPGLNSSVNRVQQNGNSKSVGGAGAGWSWK